MSVFVLIPAAGAGKRFGSATRKQYLELCGQPVVVRTLRLFNDSPQVDGIFLMAPADEIQFCRKNLVEPWGFAKVRDVVCGGAERQDSVYNGLLACGAQDGDIIIIHDGVRPLFPAILIPEVVRCAEQRGACLVAVPARDTVKEVADGQVQKTLERKSIWQAQTPQAFRFEIIMQAHERAHAEGFCGTDDASLVERLGLPVAIVEGSVSNIKITTPEDLTIAEVLGDFPGKAKDT